MSATNGNTLGIVGGGQLARMMALEARRIGVTIKVLDENPQCCAGMIAHDLIVGDVTDTEAVVSLAKQCDALTVDHEHIGVAALRAAQAHCPVFPRPDNLAIVQDRGTQRAFLKNLGVDQTPWVLVDAKANIEGQAPCYPGVLKTRRDGYDGKGQRRIERPEDLEPAIRDMGAQGYVLEAFVPFVKEVSVLVARTRGGDHRVYPVVENIHRNHILHKSLSPARVAKDTASKAKDMAICIVDALDLVGVGAVEFFVLQNGDVWVNEIAPRVHNSGHIFQDAATTSQFEQHVRALLNLPLGDLGATQPGVMLNLLGDLWLEGLDLTPAWQAPGTRVHLYEKTPHRKGRKQGHINLVGGDLDALDARASHLFETLSKG